MRSTGYIRSETPKLGPALNSSVNQSQVMASNYFSKPLCFDNITGNSPIVGAGEVDLCNAFNARRLLTFAPGIKQDVNRIIELVYPWFLGHDRTMLVLLILGIQEHSQIIMTHHCAGGKEHAHMQLAKIFLDLRGSNFSSWSIGVDGALRRHRNPDHRSSALLGTLA